MVVVGAVLSSVYFELVHNLFEAIFLVWVGGGQSGVLVSALADFSILATDRQKTNHNISLKLLTIPSHELWYKSSYIPPFHIMCIDICT